MHGFKLFKGGGEGMVGVGCQFTALVMDSSSAGSVFRAKTTA